MNIRYLVKQENSWTPSAWRILTFHDSLEEAKEMAKQVAERTGRPVKIIKQTIVEEDVA